MNKLFGPEAPCPLLNKSERKGERKSTNTEKNICFWCLNANLYCIHIASCRHWAKSRLEVVQTSFKPGKVKTGFQTQLIGQQLIDAGHLICRIKTVELKPGQTTRWRQGRATGRDWRSRTGKGHGLRQGHHGGSVSRGRDTVGRISKGL